jgi:hypothetical protein
MDTNPYASPAIKSPSETFLDKGVWRDGDLLVVRSKRHKLPDNCIVCNAPSGHRRRTWNASWLTERQRRLFLAALFVFGPLMFLFARAIGAQTAKLRVGLCGRHLWRRRRAFLFKWASIPFAVASVVYCIQHRFRDPSVYALIVLAGIAGVVYGFFLAQLVTPVRIDRGFVWLQGVPSDYLGCAPPIPQSESEAENDDLG